MACVALAAFLDSRLILVDPPVVDRSGLFRLFAHVAALRMSRAARARVDERASATSDASGLAPAPSEPPSEDALVGLLEARERQQSTLLTEGVAFPHAIAPGMPRTLVGAARFSTPLPYQPDRPPIRLCFVLFGDSGTPWVHVRTLARLARLVHDPQSRARLEAASSDEELLSLLRAEDDAHG